MYNFPIKTHKTGENRVTIHIRDLDGYEMYSSEFISDSGAKDTEALAMSLALKEFVGARKRIPHSTPPEKGEHVPPISAVIVAKIVLWNEMVDRDLKKADLYNALGVAPVLADRLIDFCFPSKMNSLEDALAALNVEIKVTPPDQQWISLAQGGFFAKRLVDAYAAAGVTEMPIGKTRGALATVKTYSLDYILRTRYARQPDTMQAVDTVLDCLEASGCFRRSLMNDPQTNREVESMALA